MSHIHLVASLRKLPTLSKQRSSSIKTEAMNHSQPTNSFHVYLRLAFNWLKHGHSMWESIEIVEQIKLEATESDNLQKFQPNPFENSIKTPLGWTLLTFTYAYRLVWYSSNQNQHKVTLTELNAFSLAENPFSMKSTSKKPNMHFPLLFCTSQ